MSDYTNIGKIVASSGLTGEVILKHALGKKTSLKPVETIFIEQHKGALIPYFIESSKAKSSEELVIKLEGVAHKEAARLLIKKNIWLLQEDFRKLVDPSSPLSLLGFTLINEGENLGPIEEVIEQPQQILLRLIINNREVLIPLHEKTLQKIDHRSKKVFVVLPEGLLDIYLGI